MKWGQVVPGSNAYGDRTRFTRHYPYPSDIRQKEERRAVGPAHDRIMKVYKPNGEVQGYAALRVDRLPLYVRETVDQAQDDLRRMLMGEPHLSVGGDA